MPDESSIREEDGAANELTARVALADAAGKTPTPLLLPGLVAIGLYMLVLAAALTFGVVRGQYPPLFLILAACFVTASFGLLRMFRWAWALTLAAVFLLASYHFWLLAVAHRMPSAIQGALNLVFFLYLIRLEVRARLR